MRCNREFIAGITGLLFLFGLFVSQPVLGQEEEPSSSSIAVMKGDGYFVWIDNAPQTYVTINFPGGKFQAAEGVPNGITVDSTFYQILKHDYTSDQYSNRDSEEKEDELLLYYLDYERTYLEDEVFKIKLEGAEEFFYNQDGKKFHLWYIQTPQSFIDQNADSDVPRYHIYLNFVANQKVYGFYTVAMSGYKIEDKLTHIKEIANTVEVYGYYVDLEALQYKVTLPEDEKGIEFVDQKADYVMDIPEWLNITKTDNEDIFIATLPDIHNIKNAVAVKVYTKEEYKSFDDFNKQKVTGYKLGDSYGSATVLLKNELPTLENSTGVRYKMQQIAGDVIYEVQFATYETATCYLLVQFTATPKTYDINVGRFESFLAGITTKVD